MNIPRELLRSTPREVALTMLGRLTLGIGVLLLAAAPLAGAAVYANSGRNPIWIAPLLCVSIGGAGAVVLWVVRRQQWMLSLGRAAVGRVTGSRKVNRGKQPVLQVLYEFPLINGAMRTGRYDAEKGAPAPGSELVVLYDPEDPSRRVRYPLPLVRCARPVAGGLQASGGAEG